MTLRKILFFICIGISALIGTAGYWQSGFMQGVIAVPAVSLLWIFARKKFSSVCLVFSIAVAATGLLTGVRPLFMLFYTGLTLASWDLNSMDLSLSSNPPDQKTNLYQFMRLRNLGFCLGLGFLSILIGRSMSLPVPFLVIALFVILAVFFFDRIVHALRNKD